ncbi:GerW family sporulation protein [Aureibacillus halotolerans]|uniref:Sporulation protein YtfJ n=1 Tax=Aureibacillus halotolerans TaxID=1508390 RepID=A0A4R6U3U7_9BACI|nr:GerW family sporulation protein [Aureibacillus halotolerans]TDQ39105.1 sporulation protein YtfJ [Aureibacillus halotolerans]
MSEHPIQSLMKTAMEHLQKMIDVNTIVGDPVETPDGSVILTVSKVGFGFAAGGSQFGKKSHKSSQSQSHSADEEGSQEDASSPQSSQDFPFGGGSGGGVSITPIAFLIVGRDGVKMVHLDETTHIYERLLDLAPQAVEKVQQMLRRQEKEHGQQTPNSEKLDL